MEHESVEATRRNSSASVAKSTRIQVETAESEFSRLRQGIRPNQPSMLPESSLPTAKSINAHDQYARSARERQSTDSHAADSGGRRTASKDGALAFDRKHRWSRQLKSVGWSQPNRAWNCIRQSLSLDGELADGTPIGIVRCPGRQSVLIFRRTHTGDFDRPRIVFRGIAGRRSFR